MSNTLIVRDATLAINGAPETRGGPHEHLEHRIEEVEHMDPPSAAACVEVLQSVVGSGEDVDVEVLEALTILGLALPALADSMGVSAVGAGRQLAARREQAGDAEYAMAVLEILLDTYPADPALERDYAAILRRQGMVHDLVQRYLDRSNRLLREGKDQEAIGWLKEALLLDRSRKDIARMIRDLRLQGVRGERSGLHLGPIVTALLLIGGMAALVLREKDLREQYLALPAVETGDLDRMQRRLIALENFVDAHPVWHGAITAVAERTDLRLEVERLEEEDASRRQAEEAVRREREEEAELARARGYMLVEARDFEGALVDFRRALELTSDRWQYREQIERDIAAISEHLEVNR